MNLPRFFGGRRGAVNAKNEAKPAAQLEADRPKNSSELNLIEEEKEGHIDVSDD